MFVSLGAETLTPSRGSSSITVRLYNVAEAPDNRVARATAEASEIFERVGVSVTWLDCSGPVPQAECNAVRGAAVVNLRLMPAHMQPKQLPRGIFGFAVMSTKGGFSSIANVYIERVSEISDGRKYRRDVLLGSMMAHELGHLLLGANSHSKKGLMTLPWGPKVLLAADRGMLSFSKSEALKIVKAVQERRQAVERSVATRL